MGVLFFEFLNKIILNNSGILLKPSEILLLGSFYCSVRALVKLPKLENFDKKNEKSWNNE